MPGLPPNYRTPTLEVLARKLARVPRWNGDTLVPWSVAQHSMVGCLLAGNQDDPVLQVQFLAHDVEEAFTGDTPRPYKTESQRKLGEAIRRDIFRNLLHLPYPPTEPWRELDWLVGEAEREILLHPNRRQGIGQLAPGIEPAMGMVWRFLEMSYREQVALYIEMAQKTLELPAVQQLSRDTLFIFQDPSGEVH